VNLIKEAHWLRSKGSIA
jgi:hypothetical protein